MPRARDFRKLGREALVGNWPMALLVTLIAALVGGLSFGTSILPAPDLYQISSYSPQTSLYNLYQLIIFIIGGAVALGFCRVYLNLHHKQDISIGILFSLFNVFGKALLLRLFIVLFLFLWALPAIILVSIFVSIFMVSFVSPMDPIISQEIFVALLIILTMPAIIPVIIAYYRYSMAPYLIAQNHELGVREAVNLSKKMMKGHKSRLFFLHLSFIGWFIFAMIPALIGLLFIEQIYLLTFLFTLLVLFIYPYYFSSQAAFFLDLQYHYQKEVIKQLEPFNETIAAVVDSVLDNQDPISKISAENLINSGDLTKLDRDD